MDMADVLLDLKLSDDIAEVAQKAAQVKILSMNTRDITGVAGEVAAHAFRKLVPPAQRMYLTYPSVGESLNLRPLRRRGEGARRLHELLARFTFAVRQQARREQNRAHTNQATSAASSPDEVNGTQPPETSQGKSQNASSATPVNASENDFDSEWDFAGGDHEGNLRDVLLKPGFCVTPKNDNQADAAKDYTNTADEVTRQHVLQSFYSAKGLFGGPVRRVVDLWHALERIVEWADQQAGDDKQRAMVRRPKSQDNDGDIPTNMHRWLRWIVSQQCLSAVLEEPALAHRPTRRL